MEFFGGIALGAAVVAVFWWIDRRGLVGVRSDLKDAVDEIKRLKDRQR